MQGSRICGAYKYAEYGYLAEANLPDFQVVNILKSAYALCIIFTTEQSSLGCTSFNPKEIIMLEFYLDSGFKLRRLRGCPVGEHMDSFADWLQLRGYKRRPAQLALRGAAHLGCWASTCGIPIGSLDETVVDSFIHHVPKCTCRHPFRGRDKYHVAGARLLFEHLQNKGFLSSKREEPETISDLISGFSDWMRYHRGVTESTLANYIRVVKEFLFKLGEDTAAYDISRVRAFIFSSASRSGYDHAKSVVNATRMFLRFLAVYDKAVLVLIGRMLKAKVVMPDGVKVSTDEGVPQGGPLSPLLSNIVLDELDWELDRRGHRFVRYADDANIYVKSEQAGQRVMANIRSFIERRLRLKINERKSAVALPEERHFLGFSLRREPEDGSVEVRLSKRSKERIDAKIRELTPRNWGNSVGACIKQVNVYLLGWIGYFGICTEAIKRELGALDAHIRRRLRAIQLKHWKRKRTIVRKLISLGVKARTAWRSIYNARKKLWKLSHIPVVERALPNRHWSARGLVSLWDRWHRVQERINAPVQLTLDWDRTRS
jgi:hypothetical protein